MVQASSLSDQDQVLDPALLAELIVDVWRIRRRAMRDTGTPAAVLVSCEVAMDRVASLGFRVEELVGQAYDPGMRVRVVDQEGGGSALRISECLSPAIYYQQRLVRQAEIVLQGEGE